jgi:hypothetical protein
MGLESIFILGVATMSLICGLFVGWRVGAIKGIRAGYAAGYQAGRIVEALESNARASSELQNPK